MARRLIVACSVSLLALALTGSARMAQADPPPDVQVSVNAAQGIGTIPATAFGINSAVWDGHLLDSTVPGLLSAAGMTIVRYPGGSTSDVYHWQDNSITPGQGGYANPNNTFDAFMSQVQKAGAQAMITVNYGSNHAGNGGGDPQEAAGWVQYANEGGPGYSGPVPTYPGASPTGHRYGITYWEIGNELYGNGTYYNVQWETDLHSDKGPVAYGQHAMEFIKAMKAVDPSIKVGVVLTAPGNWPDEDAGPTPAWNDNVISTTCSGLDFADVHWYPQGPGQESDAALLGAPEKGTSNSPSIPHMVARLRQEIQQYCPSRASQIKIMITETNSVSYNPGKQTVSLVNALFLDDNYMTWLENGVANVDWWDLHNGPVTGTNNSSSLYGTATYGDYGVLATGAAPEPPANTPFPPYYGLQMLNVLGHGGDEMVQASSDNPLVTVHAVKQANGDLAVLLINKDPNTTHTVGLTIAGYAPAPHPTVYTYGENSSSMSSAVAHGMLKTQEVGPYSLTTIVFSPQGSPGHGGEPTPELDSDALLSIGLVPVGLFWLYRRRRQRQV